jgi:DNA-binding CsgD family transcriptional regulator
MLARAHRSLLKLHTWSGPADRAWVHARSAVALAEASGARNLAWSAHWTTSVLAGFTSNTESVKHHLERATKLAVELHSPLLQLRTAEISLEFRSAVGEWDKALEQGEPAIVHARALDQTTLLARLLYWVGIVYLNRGETVEAQKLFSEAWTIAGADGIDVKRPFEVHGILPAYSARVIWLSAIGEHAQAISLGHEALAIADQTGYVAWAVYRLMPAIAESALALDKRELLADLRARLARDSALLGHAVGLGWVSVIDGELAHREGSPEVAVSCLRQAIMTLEGVPFPFDAARIRLRLARVLQAQGCVDEATFEAKAALQVFDRLKAYPSAEETRVLLKSLGARVAAPRTSQWFKGLTKTELDVTKLVARRLSNKEIGAKLGISPRTVGTHLQNIFPKTGVHNRTALGDLAREQGLHGDD